MNVTVVHKKTPIESVRIVLTGEELAALQSALRQRSPYYMPIPPIGILGGWPSRAERVQERVVAMILGVK